MISNVLNGKKSIRNIQKWLIGKNYFAFLSKIKIIEPNQITTFMTSTKDQPQI